jgi:molybdopterin-guanine dinucleotide biosynthesis protein B
LKVFGFAGWSGSGKTTLIEQIIPRLVARSVKVSLIKHAHHHFDVDQPGKDSYRHRHAGCHEVIVSSERRWALMHELRGAPELNLEQLIERMAPVDLLLVEGFKRYPQPKLEVFRRENGKPRLYLDDPHIVAVATDTPFESNLPQFALSDYDGVAQFILKYNALS